MTTDFVTDRTEAEQVAQARQAAFEAEQREAGVARFRATIERARAGGDWSTTTSTGLRLLAAQVGRLVEAVEWAQQTARCPGSYSAETVAQGRKVAYAREMMTFSAEVGAAITLTTMLDAAQSTDRCTLTAMSNLVGHRLEAEGRVVWLEREEPAFLRRMIEDLNNAGSRSGFVARRIRLEIDKRFSKAIVAWDAKDRFAVGAAMVHAALVHTDLFDREVAFAGGRAAQYVRLTDHARAWIAADEDRCGVNATPFWPMLCPPIPWAPGQPGGYLTPAVPPADFVRTRSAEARAMADAADMPDVYATVNALQDTPWRINDAVLGLAKELMARGGNAMGLPVADPMSRRPPPEPRGDLEAMDPDERAIYDAERAVYRQRQREFFAWEYAERSNVHRTTSTLHMAARLAAERIYFPHNCDFRGRIYPLPSVISPQGDDLQKALLLFDRGHAIETDEQVRWFLAHGAATYGIDKVGFEDRVRWVEEHHDAITAAGSDAPDDDALRFLEAADKPWQFYAWAREYAALAERGPGFVSRIPVAFDGTCNGLQHLSAMIRDERGGAFVNLAPGDKPSDIYAEVAQRTVEVLEGDMLLSDTEEERQRSAWAAAWLDFGVDRKVTKRTVMVIPYGGTMRACMQYVRQAVQEGRAAGKSLPDWHKDDMRQASLYLAQAVWRGVGGVLSRSKEVMSWLQKAAKLLAKEGKPLVWTAPSGFVVRQAYMKQQEGAVAFGPRRTRIQLRTRADTSEIDGRTQGQGASPNYTHSLDAAHLVSTVVTCLSYGVADFAMVHDSYAVPAAHAPILVQALRVAFEAQYAADPLRRLEAEVRAQLGKPDELEPLPEYGSWSPELIREATYFFH